jgi:hypothetical protein
MARFAPRKVQTLMTGKDLFFTYTTSSKKNSTIVAHSEREVDEKTEKAVWVLQKQDNSEMVRSRLGLGLGSFVTLFLALRKAVE